MAVTWCALKVLSHNEEGSIYCSITQTIHMLTIHLLYFFFFLMKAALVQAFAYLLASGTHHQSHSVTTRIFFPQN